MCFSFCATCYKKCISNDECIFVLTMHSFSHISLIGIIEWGILIHESNGRSLDILHVFSTTQ